MENKIKINIKVDYESRPIRHLSVQCPQCKNWFFGNEIVRNGPITEDWQLHYAKFTCPICGKLFGNGDFDPRYEFEEYEFDVEEVEYPDVYKDCKRKKIVWE